MSLSTRSDSMRKGSSVSNEESLRNTDSLVSSRPRSSTEPRPPMLSRTSTSRLRALDDSEAGKRSSARNGVIAKVADVDGRRGSLQAQPSRRRVSMQALGSTKRFQSKRSIFSLQPLAFQVGSSPPA